MSEQALAYIDNGSVFHRIDALSKLFWVLVVVIATFQFHESISRGLMLAVLLFVAIFVARVPLQAIWKVSPLIFGVASVVANRPPGVRSSRTINPASDQASARPRESSRTLQSKSPVCATQASWH